jgi:hypothetical protein
VENNANSDSGTSKGSYIGSEILITPCALLLFLFDLFSLNLLLPDMNRCRSRSGSNQPDSVEQTAAPAKATAKRKRKEVPKKDNPTYAGIRQSSNGHKKQKMAPCKSCHEHKKQKTSHLVIFIAFLVPFEQYVCMLLM